ncbi:hypothetical protein AJ79_03497 [Helicocarpus griseus UAMH5409]|uniref:Large ribosomal subunit protein mL50 n=1 Tax=Helicocarpus griseus UAMH5409 TaxID=1447875 RepID=A0A2B7XXJ0_9EURO|nr:hypothetical protein AJ79_03497 [Helicocarpus griseus UAMH5409]
MPSPARLLAPLEAAPSRISSALYVCSTCRRQCLPQSLRAVNHQLQFRRHNSNDGSNLPMTEKLRRKVWGTDNPPGLKDPYGNESQLDLQHEQEQEQDQQEEERARLDTELREREDAEEIDYNEPHVSTFREAKLDRTYKPAQTWDGLDVVGAEKWYEESPKDGDFFTPFMATEKATTREQFIQILHQAMVELMAFEKLGKPLNHVCRRLDSNYDILPIIRQATIEPSADLSSATLKFPTEEASETVNAFIEDLFSEPEHTVGESAEETDFPAEESAESEEFSEPVAAENAETAVTVSANTDFLKIPFKQQKFKFQYLKRVSQLSGHRIPDPEFAAINKPSRLISILTNVSKPKVTKLAEVLLKDERLTSLPNVKIMDRRYTPIDKEKEVGRWKLIEEELTARALPVTGRVKNG